jgi:hypothetical protein
MQGAQVQTSFSAGELSPRLRARTDIARYFDGALTLENFISHRHGGATKRPGTRYVASVKDGDDRVRLERFVFSDEQQYVLEFGPLYIRFYRYDGSGNPLQLDNAGTPTEKTTTYAADELADLKFSQSADVLVITHPSHAPATLTRTSDTDTNPASWTLADIAFVDGPYLLQNTTAITISSSATTGTVTLTASAPLFAATDVGRWVRRLNTTWGWAKITVFTSTTVVTAVVTSAFGATTAVTTWRLGGWHSAAGNWPSVSQFFQGRLWFAATTNKPQTLWGSLSGDFYTFSPTNAARTTSADYAVTTTLDDDQVNKIEWLRGDQAGLASFTSSGLFVTTSGEDGAINASVPPNTRRQNNYSAHPTAKPHQVGPSIMSWQPSRTLREFIYAYESNRVEGSDATILAEHIAVPGVVGSTFQELPDSILWTVLEDGSFVGVTLEREQRVVAWHRHAIGGEGEVESVECIRNPITKLDEVWLSVKRTIDGATTRYIEVMQRQTETDTDQADSWFLDAALRYEGAATDTITGLDHLEGATVGVLADGARHPDVVVDGGEIELEYEAENVLVGFRYESTLQTMPITPQQVPYEARGIPRRVSRAMIQFWRTLGGRCGVSSDSSKNPRLLFRSPSVPMNEPASLFTGTKEVSLDGAFDYDTTVWLHHDDPLPCTILSLTIEAEVGDR